MKKPIATSHSITLSARAEGVAADATGKLDMEMAIPCMQRKFFSGLAGPPLLAPGRSAARSMRAVGRFELLVATNFAGGVRRAESMHERRFRECEGPRQASRKILARQAL
ncbi:hypothetical protein [Paraburkholderia graminis]|uniref:hypothetical protein n=1 Tax=Paraburkholderia graminis TaxID=60548 RepID=UPI00286A082C|nr:hypothetical protein [Paraburkholderia graminis]